MKSCLAASLLNISGVIIVIFLSLSAWRFKRTLARRKHSLAAEGERFEISKIKPSPRTQQIPNATESLPLTNAKNMRIVYITIIAFCTGFLIEESFAQTLVIDQQASAGMFATDIKTKHPMQGFTPILSNIGYVSILLGDSNPGNGKGCDVYINLRKSDPTNAILAKTFLVSLPDSFSGFVTLLFSNNLAIEPGVTYIFEAVLSTNSDSFWMAGPYHGGYHGGFSYENGVSSILNFTFAEGIIRPELHVKQAASHIEAISWAGPGVLETAPSALGPWSAVTNKTANFYTIDPTALPLDERRFYRIRD